MRSRIRSIVWSFSLAGVAPVAPAQDEPAADPLRAVPAEETAAAYSTPDWEVPRTSWGHPSFEGVWSTDDMRGIPLNRPEELGSRESLTEEEFRERADRAAGGLDRAVNSETFLRNEWGVRSFGYSSLVIDPDDGRIPAMTEQGLARAGGRDRGTFGPGPFNAFDDFTLYDRCITRGVIGSLLPVIYGNGMRIVQRPDAVVISHEMIHDTRIIHLDGRPFPPESVRQWLGSSRGRWEGDTLVVDTRNFTAETSVGPNGNGTRHSAGLVLTERFTRVDPDMIEYVATLDDPVTYTAPFTIRLMISRQPDYQLYEYSCHEGNGAVVNSLSGERAFERRVAEARANGDLVPSRDAEGRNIFSAPEEGTEIVDVNAE